MEAVCLKIGSVFDECLLSDSVQKEMLVSRPIEEHTIQVAGSVAQTAQALALDPEAPALDIRSLDVVHVANPGDGGRSVVYRLKAANGGDVPLTEVDLERDFRATFGSTSDFEVACVHSPDLTMNEDYDGDADTHLLSTGSSLEPGEEGTIDIVVRLRPEASEVLPNGCFAPVEHPASSSGTAESPLGIEVKDRYDACTGIWTSPEIVTKVDLGAAPITKLEDYTLYAWTDVEMAGSFGLSKGNLGSGQDLTIASAKLLPTSDPRILGDVHVGGDLYLESSTLTVDNLQLGGRQRLAGKNPSLQVLGAQSLASDCVALMPPEEISLPPVECPPATSDDAAREGAIEADEHSYPIEAAVVAPSDSRGVNWFRQARRRSTLAAQPEAASGTSCKRDLRLKAGENASAAPGGYRLIELKAGSELVLSSGTYDVDRLRISRNGGTVTFDLSDGPITLNLHAWAISPGRNLRFVARNGSTRDIHVVYDGKQKLVLRESLVQGSWLAPYAAVTLDAGTRLEGALHAAKIKIGSGARFAGHDVVDPPDVDPACSDYLAEGHK